MTLICTFRYEHLSIRGRIRGAAYVQENESLLILLHDDCLHGMFDFISILPDPPCGAHLKRWLLEKRKKEGPNLNEMTKFDGKIIGEWAKVFNGKLSLMKRILISCRVSFIRVEKFTKTSTAPFSRYELSFVSPQKWVFLAPGIWRAEHNEWPPSFEFSEGGKQILRSPR